MKTKSRSSCRLFPPLSHSYCALTSGMLTYICIGTTTSTFDIFSLLFNLLELFSFFILFYFIPFRFPFASLNWVELKCVCVRVLAAILVVSMCANGTFLSYFLFLYFFYLSYTASNCVRCVFKNSISLLVCIKCVHIFWVTRHTINSFIRSIKLFGKNIKCFVLFLVYFFLFFYFSDIQLRWAKNERTIYFRSHVYKSKLNQRIKKSRKTNFYT